MIIDDIFLLSCQIKFRNLSKDLSMMWQTIILYRM